jgi:hypothetical protein
MSTVVAQNEWSCALACIVSLASDHGIQVTQQEVTTKFAASFPEWRTRAGLLSRMDVLRLVELLGLPVGYVLVTPDLQEFLSVFSKRHNNWVGGFAFLHHPTHHCLRICGVSGDVGDLLDPAQQSPSRAQVRWSDLAARKPEFILICD